jgi:UDP-2,3-diacylglucosamine hydrolase
MSSSTWTYLTDLPEKSLFISDIHLGALPNIDDQELQELAVELLQKAALNGYTLFLLGDIFDYWLEQGNDIPPVGNYFRAKLAELAKNHSIYMVSGNHDNWTNGYFSKLGITETKEGVLSKNGYLLAHGDGFKGGKYGLPRPLKHRVLRNPYFIKLFIFLFGKEGAWQKMQAFSKNSSLKPKNPHQEVQRLNKWAKDVIENQGLNMIICGHDHQARLINFEKGIYLNTGFFLKDHTFGLLEHGKVKLMKVEATNRSWQVVSETSLS